MEELAKIFIGEWGWMFVVAVATLAFRDTLSKTWQGFMFLIGNDFNRDDIVWINGVKKARIVRQSLYRDCLTILAFLTPFIHTMSSRLKSFPIKNINPCHVLDKVSLNASVATATTNIQPHSPINIFASSSIY